MARFNISKLHCLEVYDENLWFGVLRWFVGGQGWLLMVSSFTKNKDGI